MAVQMVLQCLSLLAVGSTVAQAQVFKFQKEAVPDGRSLRGLYAFFVYSERDAPAHSKEGPSVVFRDFEGWAHHGDPTDTSVQVSLVRYEDFWELIDPKRFCSTPSDVTSGRSFTNAQLLLNTPPGKPYGSNSVYMHSVPFSQSSGAQSVAVKSNVSKSGVYILVFSNCGASVDAVVSGTVVVRNSYGFLPGNEYHKKPFYGTLLLICSSLLVVWSVLSLRWWKSLNQLQGYIFFVILTGVIEALLWYVFFNDFNFTGIRRGFLFSAAILFAVMRTILSYMLVLVAALGWGVTKPYLETSEVCKIQVISFCYLICAFTQESILSYRQCYGIALHYVIMLQMPASLISSGICYWIFSSHSSLMQSLRDQGQSDKVRQFKRFGMVLLAALSVALMLMIFQLVDLAKNITETWTFQWVLTDGISHVQFLLALLAMMCLWPPGESDDGYLGAQPVKTTDGEEGEGLGNPPAIWGDEDAELLGEGEQGAQPPAAAEPEVIGAPAADSGHGGAAPGGAE